MALAMLFPFGMLLSGVLVWSSSSPSNVMGKSPTSTYSQDKICVWVPYGVSQDGSVTIAGVLRDSLGIWKLGFVQHLSPLHVLEAELYAIRMALQSLLQFSRLEDCRHYMTCLPTVRLIHIPRMANRAAHRLAQYAKRLDPYLHILYNPPNEVCNVLCTDILACTHPDI